MAQTGEAADRAVRHGGQVLAETLAAQGIDHVFAVPGESYLAVLDGLYSVQDRIRLITCRFEAGAANMAEAFGKLTGRPAAAFVTRGPGACHAAIGVHIAQQDSTPMLLFVGQIPFAETDRESFQEVDYRRMFAPLAKWVTQIDDAKRIPEIVAHAVDVATRGRPGPVVIALSEEMQTALTGTVPVGPARVMPGTPDPAAIAAFRAMLANAKRPLAVLGGSFWSDAGRAAMRGFLHDHAIPVCAAFRRQDVCDGMADNYAGDLGVGSDPALVARVKEADLVLAVGTRLGEAVTQGYTLFPSGGSAKLVHVYPEAAEIGRVFRPALGIVADASQFALALARMQTVAPAWREWTQSLRALRVAASAAADYPGPLNLSLVLKQLETLLPPDAIVTSDAGNFAAWFTRFVNFSGGQRYLGPANGAMGYGVPAAIAAKIAFPDRMVVATVGDGGFMMTGQEIATAFHHGVAPVILVFNNQMYGTIRMYQERAYPGRIAATQLTNPDFAKFIEAFGGHGEVVADTEAFGAAFARAVASGKPALIEIRMSQEQITSRATVSALRLAGGG
jgi:acetolactate synthase-1/2/3 large subunit